MKRFDLEVLIGESSGRNARLAQLVLELFDETERLKVELEAVREAAELAKRAIQRAANEEIQRIRAERTPNERAP